MILALLLGLLLLGIALALLVRALSAPSSNAAERLAQIEAYGFSAEALAQAAGPGSGLAAPATGVDGLAARLGDMVARRFGRTREADLRAELMAAGMYTTSPRTLLGYRVMGGLVLPLVLLALGAAGLSAPVFVMLMTLAVGVGWMAPLVLVRRRARERLQKIDRALPELIDILVVTVEAGLAFSASLRVAAREFTGPLHEELLLTLQEQSMGLAVSEALTNMLQRADTPAMRSFVRSVIQGETLGVSTGTIMRNLAVEMRKRRRAAAEEQAQKAPIKILFPLVFLIFPTLFIVLLVPALFKLSGVFN